MSYRTSVHLMNGLLIATEHQKVVRRTVEAHGLNLRQWMILTKLSQHRQVLPGQLAKALHCTPELISMVGRDLLDRGLMVRGTESVSDLRTKSLCITEAGQQALSDIHDALASQHVVQKAGDA